MNFIKNIVEPDRLLLVWQPHQSIEENQRRRLVGELLKKDGSILFRYISKNNSDLEEAKALGLQHYPNFIDHRVEYSENVLKIFCRRLPPKSRKDFQLYKRSFRIPPEVEISDFALLGYTNAKLPSDGFSIIHTFDQAIDRCELLTEIAGFRFQHGVNMDLKIGEPLKLEAEPENIYDPNAIRVLARGVRIGYINKYLSLTFGNWMKSKNLELNIEKYNMIRSVPRVSAFVKVY